MTGARQAALAVPGALAPGRDASGEAEAEAEVRAARPYLLLALGVLLSVTVLQRFAVPGSGGALGVGFAACWGLWALATLRGALQLDAARLALFALAAAGLFASLFAQTGGFSAFSLAMTLILYLPFCAAASLTPAGYGMALEVFQRVMALSAAAGLFQFALQFAGGAAAMFPLDGVLPASLFIQGFNLQIPVGETGLLKSTGLWFLEPSHFSQFLALALVVELARERRPWLLGLLGCAYLVSFSGTGAMLLAAALPWVALRTGQAWLIGSAVLFVLALPFLGDVPPFSFFVERLEEFDSSRSSAAMRVFGPWWASAELFASDPRALLFGVGPGGVEDAVRFLDYEVQDSSWFKLVVEYGVLGAAPFALFYLHALFRHSPDRLLSFCCLFQVLFLGGYLNAFYVQFLHMVLVAWPRVVPPAQASNREGARP